MWLIVNPYVYINAIYKYYTMRNTYLYRIVRLQWLFHIDILNIHWRLHNLAQEHVLVSGQINNMYRINYVFSPLIKLLYSSEVQLRHLFNVLIHWVAEYFSRLILLFITKDNGSLIQKDCKLWRAPHDTFFKKLLNHLKLLY